MNILIVDDQPVNLKLLHATLEAEGHTVAEAGDGVEALQVLQNNGADAIISDILMPRMDGYRLCREVRKQDQFKDLPFIMYTSTYVSPSDEKLSLDLGADVFLRKPAPAKQIIETLHDVTSSDRSKRAAPSIAIPESDVMKEYSERLVAKLEQKNQELAQTLEELRSEKSRLRHLLTHTPAVIYSLNIDGEKVTPVFVSDNMERLLGFTAEESCRFEWWLDSLHPEDRDRVLALLTKSMSGNGYSMEYRIRHKDGTYHWVQDDNRLIRDADGQPKEMVGVWTDITERKKTEQRLSDQAKIIDRAQDAIMIRNYSDLRIIFWNKAAERLYGWTADEALDRSDVTTLVDPRQVENIMSTLRAAGEFRGEIKQRTKDGRELTAEARATLVRDADGAPRSILIICTDTTEQKKLETQLLRAQRLESIGTLASGVAHDLNNILTPILMCAEVLGASVKTEDDSTAISLIGESARRGAGIVKQVLTFARGIEGERVLIKPSHLIEEMTDIARKTFPKSIEIISRYPEDLWSIEGDPTQLHQVLLNLSVNARDAMPNGGRLSIEGKNFNVDEHYASMTPNAKPGPHVMLRVSDTGTGMPRANIDKIFDPFFTTKEIGKGTGLGLSTALGIIKSHAGFISVYSELGTGTTFKVLLPAKVTEEISLKSKMSTELAKGNGELVFVVDDEPGILHVTQMILEKNNYRVVTANDGPEALALIAQQSEPTPIVLTDINMPYMDGVALVRAIKKMKPNTTFIASTGQGEETRVDELQSLGVANVLTKPYDTGKLLQTIQTALQRKG